MIATMKSKLSQPLRIDVESISKPDWTRLKPKFIGDKDQQLTDLTLKLSTLSATNMDNLLSRYKSLCVKYTALGGQRPDHDLCYGLFSLIPKKIHITTQLVKSSCCENGTYSLDKVIAA